MGEELWRHTARELAGLIAAGEVTSREVVESHLERIEAVNPTLNAVVRLMADEALAAADAADAAVTGSQPLGPLHGVPVTVKENIDVAGVPTTEGVPAFADAVAPLDAPVVERLRSAGAIPVARTNMPDFGLRVHTTSALHGLTRNPWNLERTTGGSSGGEGAALATGMSPLGLGNDIGGSLRNPAYCCGIASLKPSAHRVPDASSTSPVEPFPAAQLMSVQGPMARRVADVRVAFEVLAGPHPRSPWTVPAPLSGAPLSKRVAVVAEPPGGATDPAVSAAVRAAAEALDAAGYELVEVQPPGLEEAHRVWLVWLGAELTAIRPLLELVMSPEAVHFLDLALEANDVTPADLAGVMEALGTRHRLAREWGLFFEDCPLVLGPTWTARPFEAGFDVSSLDGARATLELLRFVTPQNLLGLPAACVPTGVGDDGLPLGVQVTGPAFREDLCLGAAEVIESASDAPGPIDPVAA